MKRFFLAATLALGPGCSVLPSFDPDSPRNASRENALRHLDLARAELAAGDIDTALDRLLALHAEIGLAPEHRVTTDALLEEAADRTLAEGGGSSPDVDELEDLYSLDLPPRLKARAGVHTARALLEAGRRVPCFKMIKRLEQTLPGHPERALAGDVLGRCGFALVDDPGRYWLLFHYRSRGIEALEFLVLAYPFDHRAAEAYATLARVYEEEDEIDSAIERCEDLVLFHPESPLAVEAAAKLAKLRLHRLERDDFDRGELELARAEAEGWLERHAGHPLEQDVRSTLARADARLAASDLMLARFYARIDDPRGARLHAERAVLEALAGGERELADQAQVFLASLPTEPVAPDRRAERPEPVEDVKTKAEEARETAAEVHDGP